MNKKQVYILIALLVAVFAFFGFLIWKDRAEKQVVNPPVETSLTQRPAVTEEVTKIEPATPTDKSVPKNSTSVPSKTPGWTLYTNHDLGFSLEYPDEYTNVFQSDGPYERVVNFGYDKMTEVSVVFGYYGKETNLKADYGYSDSKIIDNDVLINGKKFFKAIIDSKASNPGQLGLSYINYGIYIKDHYCYLILYGDTEVSSIEKKIIDSFKITE